MCGIIGGINFKSSINSLAVELISHRGPDGSGIHNYKNVQLGHTRLSILDLSENGSQPMLLEDHGIAIIFNGEVYNHFELREQLDSRIIYRSSSDTETLLYCYLQWGTEMFEKLNGIFSLAILDKRLDKLVLARDQFGVKPLYVYQKDEQVLFSSELKAIKGIQGFDKALNYESISNYITFLWSPGESTPFKYVSKLLPGHYCVYHLSTPVKPVLRKYYDIPFKGDYTYKNESEAIKDLELHLENAVSRQMLSDVPVGFFLSGGLDSSAMVALARKLNPDLPIECFTIDTGRGNFEGFAKDLPYAKKVAQHLGVNLNIIPAKSDIVNDFDRLIYHLDEPQADAAPLNVFNIARAAREKGIKVLIGGAAGDDIFTGYRRHQALRFESLFGLVPQSIGKLVNQGTQLLDSRYPFGRRAKKLTANIDKSSFQRMFGYLEWFPLDRNKLLFSDDIKSRLSNYNPANYYAELLNNIPNEQNKVNQMLYWEMKGFLVDHNLNYTDKMSMAAGVEARVPFLDLDLVNFSTRLSPDLKMRGGETKYILKKVMEKYLPREVIYRPKTGFGAPVREWVLNDLHEKIQDELSVESVSKRGIFNPQEVQRLINDNRSGKIDASYTIWSLLAIESWLKQFVD